VTHSATVADLPIDDGPQAWRLWRAALAGAPSAEGWEALLYTDAHPVGDITDGLGPFQLFPTMTDFMNDSLAPRLAVRIHWYDPGQAPARSKSKIRKEGTTWLGMDAQEEIACLLSLVLGSRVRSGGKVRTFSTENPVGRPYFAEHTAPAPHVPSWNAPMLPGHAGTRVNLPPVGRSLSRYPGLEAQEAVVLVRAARHYSTALWVADSDPEQAWLQLVSALETVATHWKAAEVDPAELFADAYPDPAALLRESGGDELLANVARHFTKLIGAGRRYQDFIEKFKPEPPYERPPVATIRDYSDESGAIKPQSPESISTVETRVDWDNLRPTLSKIYAHRSALLHSGTPFPAVLCFPPILIDGVPTERPIGRQSNAGNTAWAAEDTPIHLHTFAYLARGTLLNWWAERAPADGTLLTPAQGPQLPVRADPSV
jgi:hypothetical protein